MKHDGHPHTITPFKILRALAALRRNLAMYPDGHQVVGQSSRELLRVLTQAFEENARVRIEVVAGIAHLDGYPFRIESQASPAFVQELESVGVQCLQIAPGVEAEELVETAALLNDLRERKHLEHSLHQELGRRGVGHVNLTKLLPVNTRRRSGTAPPVSLPEPRDPGYAEALESASESLGPVFEGSTPDGRAVQHVLERIGDQILDRNSALSEILAVKRYENHTYCHSVNVASLSVLLGRRLGLDEGVLEVLAQASLLHDIGKRGVPSEILNKPGPLNRREWRIMKRHPAMGAEALISGEGLSPLCATVALEHHRHYRGDGGYPNLGHSVPHLVSQIVAVTDTYEALTGSRAYRAPLTPDEACLILAGMSGEKLNPDFLRAFVSLITFFPLGSVVRTSQDEVGVVVDTREREPLHPTIYTIDHPSSGVPAGQRIDTSVRDASGEHVRHILESLPETTPKLPEEAWERPGAAETGARTEGPVRQPPGQRPRREGRRPITN